MWPRHVCDSDRKPCLPNIFNTLRNFDFTVLTFAKARVNKKSRRVSVVAYEMGAKNAKSVPSSQKKLAHDVDPGA
jgi:hypothetical protein